MWAERAGLGWIGKSGNLVTRRFGTWVLLAALLVDLELEPDAPHADHCGSCTACLDACPTGAIVSPGVVDARRCLSYHSIEHREAWPDEVAERAGGWMYGCDVCQDVCPWSVKFAEPGRLAAFAPRPEVTTRRLAGWIPPGGRGVVGGHRRERPAPAGARGPGARRLRRRRHRARRRRPRRGAGEPGGRPGSAVRRMARWALGRRRGEGDDGATR